MWCALPLAVLLTSPVRTETIRADRPGYYSLRAAFLRFATDTPVRRLANTELRAYATDLQREWVKNALLMIKELPKPTHLWEFEVSMTASVNNPELVSVLAEIYDNSGGAHPNSSQQAHNFALLDGKAARLTFDRLKTHRMSGPDLFNRLLLARVNAAKASRGGSPLEVLDGELRDNFLITPSGMTWYFPAYSVGPYAEGAYTVKVLWGDLGRVPDVPRIRRWLR